MKIYSVIMAGGHGERFWPMSRRSTPKQLLRLLGESSLVEQTVSRLTPLVPPENILIVTNADYVEPIRALLPQLPPENIIGEPEGRDTAPCIALAAGVIAGRGDADAVMCVLPADHLIHDKERFLAALADAADLAGSREEALVTFGIRPTFANTGYGYIFCREHDFRHGTTRFRPAMSFREKPDLATAEGYLRDERYVWNGGIFVWRRSAISAALAAAVPALHELELAAAEAEAAGRLDARLPELYAAAPKISIDYAVMERNGNIVVADADFDWDDVGSWPALRNHLERDGDGNADVGRTVRLDCRDSLLVNADKGHLVTAIGLDDMVVVHTPDATLVMPAAMAQQVKELLRKFATPELEKYL